MRIIRNEDYEYSGFSGGRFIFKDLRWNEFIAIENCKFIYDTEIVIMMFTQEHYPCYEYSYATARRIHSGIVQPPKDLPFVVSMPKNDTNVSSSEERLQA